MKQVEDTRQLQQEYEHAVSQYEQLETAYRNAVQQSNEDAANTLYTQMDALFPTVASLNERLKTARGELAQARDEARIVVG